MTDYLKPLSWLGIGSVPFKEGANSCKEIFERWDLPFWPQYPKRSLRENFVFQFLSAFPGLEVTHETASFDEGKFRGAFSKKRFLSFEPPSEWALGLSQMKALLDQGAFSEKRVIKLQVTGPGTVWKSFFADQIKGNADEIQKELVRTLTAAGLAQIERVRSYGRTPLLLIDEPIRAKNLSGLSEMVHAFRNSGSLVGLHVCSSAAWEGFEALGIHLFHFDLTAHPELSSENRSFLQNFLKRKNWVAWGVVPTACGSDFQSRDFSDFLLERLKEMTDEELTAGGILKRSLLAAACGTGTLTLTQDEAVRGSLRMTSESLSLYLKNFRLKYELL